MRRFARRAPLPFVLAFVACSSDDPDPSCLEKGTCTLTVSGGDNQSGVVGQPLRDPLVVQALDENLLPAPVSITWSVVEGGGSVMAQVMTTDAEGRAEAMATLGTRSGPAHRFQASIDGLAGQTVQFSASANPGEAENFDRVGGGGQTGTVGEPLAESFQVRVTDRFGNGVPAFSIRWSAAPSPASIDPATSMTDATGMTSARGTLGQMPGTENYLFVARAEGIMANPIDFTASANPGRPSIMVRVSGDEQAGIPGQRLAEPFVVRVTDRFNNVVAGSTVTFSAPDGMGSSVETMQASSDAMGLARSFGILGNTPGDYTFQAAGSGLMGSPISFRSTAFPPICSVDNWCWQSPLPQGNTLFGAYTASPTSVWVVGEGGTILRFNGVAWARETSGTTTELRAIHGIGENLMVAVGEGGTLTTFDGANWTATPGTSGIDLEGVWLANATDGWAVGAQGRIQRFDGTGWTAVQSPTTQPLNAIHGLSPEDVWIAGDRGTIFRWEGMAWNQVAAPSNTDLNGVWAVAPNEVWFVGDGDTIFRWDGMTVIEIASAQSQILRGVWGRRRDEVFAFGDSGRIRRFDGVTWRLQSSRTISDIYGMTGIGDDTLGVGEGGTFVRNVGGQWTTETRRPRDLQAVWGPSADRAWAVAPNSTILEWDGRAWNPLQNIPRSSLRAVTGTSATDVWAVGDDGVILRYDGSTWTSLASASVEDLLSVWPVSSTVAFAVGLQGTIIRWDGTRWSAMQSGVTEDLYGVYGTASNNMWAVGGGGRILRWDGTSWTAETSPTQAFLLGIRGTGRRNIWAWGTGGTILRYDGAAWSVVPTPVTTTLFAIWPFDNDNAVAVGDRGTILVRDSGPGWRIQQSGTLNQLFGVWGASLRDLWTVGESSSILRRQR